MLWAKNKGNFSVIFTEESADQTLLAAIEKELTSTQYQTFSNLCKQALWQFLSVSELGGVQGNAQRLEERLIELQQRWIELEKKLGATVLNPVSLTPTQPIPPVSFPNLEGVEKHLVDLEKKLVALETHVHEEGMNHRLTLEQQLSQLSQQITQLQGSVNSININSPNLISDFSPAVLESPSTEVVETVIPEEETPPQEVDPVLNRLSGLLDSF